MSYIELFDTISSIRQADVFCCAFSGRLLAVGSSDKLVRLFNFDEQNGAKFHELRQSPLCGHSFGVYDVSFSNDGLLLASVSQDGNAIIWDIRTGRQLGKLSHESGMALRVCQFSIDGRLLAMGSDDEAASFWNVQSRNMISCLEGHESSVTALSFSPDGAYLITGSSLGDLRLWDARFGHRRHLALEKEAHDLGVTCASFSPTCSRTNDINQTSVSYWVASGGNDDNVRLWRIQTSNATELIFNAYTTLTGHTHNVMCVAFSSAGDMLSSGGGDKTVIVWNPITGIKLHQLRYHSRYVTCVAFSGDDQLLISGSNDKRLAVWKISSNQDGHGSPIKSLKTHELGDFTTLNSAKPVLHWNTDDVCIWLNRIVKNNDYGPVFKRNSIDGQELMLLNDTMLKNALAIKSLGHRNGILRGIKELREQSEPISKLDEFPDEFRCPITHEIMKDPVIAGDGYTYERNAISDWMAKGHKTSPMTNVILPHIDLIPNRMLKMLIQKCCK